MDDGWKPPSSTGTLLCHPVTKETTTDGIVDTNPTRRALLWCDGTGVYGCVGVSEEFGLGHYMQMSAMLKAKLLCPDGQTSFTVTIYVATYWFYYSTYRVYIKSYLYYENVESNSITIDRINRIELGLCLHWSIFWGWSKSHSGSSIIKRPQDQQYNYRLWIEPWHLRLGTAESFRFGYNRPMNVINGPSA
jgi:hypothetical protein